MVTGANVSVYSGTDNPEMIENLENIAHIFGIDTTEIFK